MAIGHYIYNLRDFVQDICFAKVNVLVVLLFFNLMGMWVQSFMDIARCLQDLRYFVQNRLILQTYKGNGISWPGDAIKGRCDKCRAKDYTKFYTNRPVIEPHDLRHFV